VKKMYGWYVRKRGDGQYAVLRKLGEFGEEEIFHGSRSHALLIAAAPDLLDALRRIADDDIPPLAPGGVGDIEAFARAAIAKAEGKQP
jgi:hypothetical protein